MQSTVPRLSNRALRPHNLSGSSCARYNPTRSTGAARRLYSTAPPSSGKEGGENASKGEGEPSSSPRTQQTQSGQRDRSTVGVFTPKAAALFILTGAGLYAYFRYEKERLLEEQRKQRQTQSYGRPSVGGPFTLTTHDGKEFTEKDLLGKWSLIYFGFTNCPDICPEELDKMTAVVDELDKSNIPTLPIFISVDPARDSTRAISLYIRDFHPRLVGLSGTYEQTRAACKAYRVYFSTPKDAKPTDDYLVDHSIYFYLMDPEGKFVEAFGRTTSAGEVVERVKEEVERWGERK